MRSAGGEPGLNGPLLTGALLLGSCQQLIGIEELHEQPRPGATDSAAPGGAMDPRQSPAAAGAGPGSGPQPESDACNTQAQDTDCFTRLGNPGRCGPAGTCVEYCILDQSLIDQCQLL